MNNLIRNELNDFTNSHKNIINVSFHILCGFIFMSFLFLLFDKYTILAILLYILIIYLSLNNLRLTFIVFIILLILNIFLKQFKLSIKTMLFCGLLFYLLPDATHILTNEKTVLKIDSASSILVNIFYLLPFSILSLFNIK